MELHQFTSDKPGLESLPGTSGKHSHAVCAAWFYGVVRPDMQRGRGVPWHVTEEVAPSAGPASSTPAAEPFVLHSVPPPAAGARAGRQCFLASPPVRCEGTRAVS